MDEAEVEKSGNYLVLIIADFNGEVINYNDWDLSEN